jgi:hypothetical protein
VDPHELKEFWLNRAIASAGIDRANWRPARGFAKNRRTAEDVYIYYGRLFLAHPYLRWAGLANLIGPTFYAGFRDLGVVPDGVQKALHRMRGRVSPGLVKGGPADLGFYETTFLRMQKKIFEDQATMHEAYLDGGVPKIEELFHARIIDAATLEAWRRIDAGRNGDPALVDSGNRMLLFREQFDIIDRFYLQMFRRHRPMGQAFTYLLTLAGAPSVPGAHSFPEQYPRSFAMRLPLAAVSVRTPLANGNIAMFANRWKLIDDDTLPDYLALVRDHADAVRKLVESPVSRRASRYLLLGRVGRIAAAALTRWEFAITGVQADGPGAFAAWPAKPLLAAETGDSVIGVDLTYPPPRGSPSFATDTDSQVWMNPNRRPFEIAVALPDRREYRAQGAMAVMLSSMHGGDPDRLIVQLQSLDAPAAGRLIARYAAEWGFPADAVAGWRAGVDRRVSSDRHYSTHVFTPGKVGFVDLEFQVSHHVREKIFVVTALFSWYGHAA